MTSLYFKNAHILLGVSGGISAYKSADLCRRFIKQGAQVRVIMTRNATEFVAPLTFETLSLNRVYVDMFDREHGWEVEHISVARWGEILVIAPATANVIAKLAHGIADDPLSTTALAFRGPLLLAPAMNTAMWEHPQTRENVERLKARGVLVVVPESGELACGEQGAGRLPEPVEILEKTVSILAERFAAEPLNDKRVLITAGPTVEPIDPVRYISNPSTGRMGFALAAEAARRGARVTLIHGPTALNPPEEMNEVAAIQTAQDMRDAVLARLDDQDICAFTAAVADFAPERASNEKIKKNAQADSTELRLAPTPDIAAEANAARRPGQVMIGFAAETENLAEAARGKMERKGFDLVIGNLVSAQNPAFADEENEVTVFDRDGGEECLPRLPKTELARNIWDQIAGRYQQTNRPSE